MRKPGHRIRSLLIIPSAAFLFFASSALAQYRIGPVYPPSGNVPAARVPSAQSGYDPFVIDSRTGRFNYVPIPYDPEPPGMAYSPYRFNWHSGTWDYVPVPLALDYEAWNNGAAWNNYDGIGGNASNFLPEQSGLVTGTPASGMAPPIATFMAPTPQMPPIQHEAPQQTPKHEPTTTRPADETLADIARGQIGPHAPALPQDNDFAGEPAQQKQSAKGKPAATGAAKQRIHGAAPVTPGEAMGDGWYKVRGIVGRWSYDTTTARWVFVLPPG